MTDSKVVAVVGVGPATGGAVATRFAREGYSVALMARRQETLSPVEAEITGAGGKALALPTDATDPASVAASFAKAAEVLGPIDVLVYNAGVFKMGGLLEIDDDEFVRCWQANCAGAFYSAKQVLPAMAERKSGTVILTGATASLRGSAKFSCLAVGKFGLRALAQSMAREFGPQGVHVAHLIIDGQINTPMWRERFPDRAPDTLLDPAAIAETYWQLHNQVATAWTLELDLRPAVEKF
jgi:NAD(P)-dependent dehydrogenase (short-subunit alcohol dehydrogenase family)